MNSKFNITSDLYWLSNRGKPLRDFVSLKEISGAVIMNGRLTGGAKSGLKGCENDAGARKFDSLISRYEIKCSPQDLIGDMENVKISGCVINTMPVWHPGVISLQKVKVHQNLEVMPSVAF